MPDLSNGADSGNNSLRGGKKSYTRGALEGNWTEDRCDPKAGRGRFTTRRFVTVLDEAMSSPYPARRFASHRHCQYVLDLYLVGIYRGSIVSLPMGTTVLRVLLQTLFQLLQPLLLFHR